MRNWVVATRNKGGTQASSAKKGLTKERRNIYR